jgi:hypothetical protein
MVNTVPCNRTHCCSVTLYVPALPVLFSVQMRNQRLNVGRLMIHPDTGYLETAGFRHSMCSPDIISRDFSFIAGKTHVKQSLHT